MEKNNGRIAQLDGLRGIAVLFVVFFHYLNNAYAASAVHSLNVVEITVKKITYWGWAGVDLFFILSGYLIASILLKNRGSKNYFSTFYIRRFTRIVPIYYLLLIAFSLASMAFADVPAKLFARPIDISWYAGFLQNFQMSARGSFGSYGLAPTWSLAVEEQFYLIIPVVIYFLNDKKVFWFCMLCILAAPVYRHFCDNWYRGYTHLFSRIDAPCYGVVLALFMKNHDWRIWVKKNAWVILAFILAVVYAFLVLDVKSLNHSIISMIFLTVTLFTLGLEKNKLAYRALTIPFLQHIGKYSYFIYLFHILVNGVLFLLLKGDLAPKLETYQGYLVTILSFTTTVVLASLSFKYLEGKWIGWSHRFTYQ